MEISAKNVLINGLPGSDPGLTQKMPLQVTIREPGSSLTHLVGMLLAAGGAMPLLIKGARSHGFYGLVAMSIFIFSMILLYGASALYHGVNRTGESLKIFKKLDHMMIFVLIAGSYTPVCMLILEQPLGFRLLAFVWAIAIIGMIFKFFWVTCPKWLSSALYVSMGWVVIFALRPLYEAISLPAFLWLLAGGITYTIGGVLYAMKLKVFNSRHRNFGSHEIFHLFVMGGSLCHYVFTYLYVA